MQDHQKQLFIARIMAGYFQTHGLKVRSPFLMGNYKAEAIYERTYEGARSLELLEDADILQFLLDTQQWTEKDEYRLETQLNAEIEDTKINLYKVYYQSTQREGYRGHLNRLRKEQTDFYERRHAYDTYTCAGVANYIKWQYLIKTLTFYKGKPYRFKKFSLDYVLNQYQKNVITEPQIRELAKTEPWKSMWLALKQNGKIFGSDLTFEQMRLIQYSSFYENVYQSHECPPDEIIKDDDALDGWMLTQGRERTIESRKKTLESKLGNKQASEVYVMCDTAEDAKIVREMNTPVSQAMIQSRENQLKKTGTVDYKDFSDIRQKRMGLIK